MQPEQGIKRELSIGQVLSKTFDSYRRDFSKYFVLFLIVGIIIGIVTALAASLFVFPARPPMNATPQQFSDYLSRLFTNLSLYVGTIFIVSVVLSPIAQGTAVKLASQQIEKGQADLGTAVRFAVSKLLWIWAQSIVLGIIIFLGTIALIIPGIVLAIMFSLAFPVLIIENKGVFDSMGRSRELVSHRWLKTFATFLVMIVVVVIASLIVSTVTGPLGPFAGPIVNGILSAFYQPLLPILGAAYYYSNLARITQPPPGQMPTATPITFTAGMMFCPHCGTQLASSTPFCPKCGAGLI